MGIEVINVNEDAIIWQDELVNDGCAPGIHGPWEVDSANSPGVINGDTYYAVAAYYFPGGVTEKVGSPEEVLSY